MKYKAIKKNNIYLIDPKILKQHHLAGDELYMDEHGDIANEFYIAVNDGSFLKVWPK